MGHHIEYEQAVDWELENNPAKIVVRQEGEISFDQYDGTIADGGWYEVQVFIGDDLLTDWSTIPADEHKGLQEQIAISAMRGREKATDSLIASLPDGGDFLDDEGD